MRGFTAQIWRRCTGYSALGEALRGRTDGRLGPIWRDERAWPGDNTTNGHEELAWISFLGDDSARNAAGDDEK